MLPRGRCQQVRRSRSSRCVRALAGASADFPQDPSTGTRFQEKAAMRNLSRILFASLGASVAVPVLAVGLQIGHRPEIGGIAAPKTVKPGEIVKITVSAKNDGSSGCGLLVNFGDGTDRQMKMNRGEATF